MSPPADAGVPAGAGIRADAVPTRRLGYTVRRFQGRLLIANGDDSFELTDTAAFILKHVNGSTSVAEIGLRLAEVYGIPEPEAAQDTAEFLAWLAEQQLIDIPA